MSVHVQGTVNANPLTQTSEPASPFSGTSLTVGSPTTVNVGPYTNNASVPLKITTVAFPNQINCTAAIQASESFPLLLAAGASVSLFVVVTPTAPGPYSFDVSATWST